MIRTKQQALAEAVKRWGKQAAVRDAGKRFADGTPRPETEDERAEYSKALADHREREPKAPQLSTFGDDRTVGEWRAENRLFQIERGEWKKLERELFSLATGYRYSVGISTWAFEIKGQGCTWDEAFAEADRKEKGLAERRR